MFWQGFPANLQDDVKQVLALMPMRTYSIGLSGVSNQWLAYQLGENKIQFPERIYFLEMPENTIQQLSPVQQLILSCIYSRSCEGRVREKHLKRLLAADYPNWAIPYIYKLCDEYVIEILQTAYAALKEQDTDSFKQFCQANPAEFCKSHSRMISYWNAYYRKQSFAEYVGQKLFTECFGYTRAMERKL